MKTLALLLALLPAMALLPVCGGGGHRTPRRPPRVDASRYRTRWPIKHVVFILKENRSFAPMSGTFPGAEGATTGLERGNRVPLTSITDQRAIPAANLAHAYRTALINFDHGKMDGFGHDPISRQFAYTQLRADQIP